MTMKRMLLLPLALAAACASTGPSSRGTPVTAAGAAEYFPLAVGNQWVWDDLSPQLPGGRPAARTVTILEKTPDGYFRDNERTELRADGQCVRDRLRRLLCAPLEVGNAWRSVVSVSSTERFEIVGVGESIEVPAGRFDRCVRVRGHNRAGPKSEHVVELTYAPGVGPVRLETWALVDGNAVPQVRAVLRSFRRGGQ